MKNYAKRRGFTLVELLIVIVVIGILSAMMMLSSTEAVSSAKAAKIISDLRNLKTAALAWYADNIDFVEGRTTDANGNKFTFLNDNRAAVLKYMGNDAVDDRYVFSDGTRLVSGQNKADNMTWFVWWKYDGDEKVLQKLAARGQTAKLRFTHSERDWQPSADLFDTAKLSALSDKPWGVGLYIFGKHSY